MGKTYFCFTKIFVVYLCDSFLNVNGVDNVPADRVGDLNASV